jgi:hypothetical protein
MTDPTTHTLDAHGEPDALAAKLREVLTAEA